MNARLDHFQKETLIVPQNNSKASVSHFTLILKGFVFLPVQLR